MKKEKIQLTLDSEVKEAAEALLEDMGLSLETAITVFLKQVVREQRIPFRITLDYPKVWGEEPDSK